MTRRALMLLPVASLFGACADKPEHYQSPNTCFVALPLICEQHVKTMPTRADDPLLGICLPYVQGTLTSWFATGSSVATIHYGSDGSIDDIASECGQGQTMHTTAQRDADGRVARWTMPVEGLTVSEENELDWGIWLKWKWYAERRATYDASGLLIQEDSGGAGSGEGASHRTLTYEDGRVASLHYEDARYPPAGMGTATSATVDLTFDYTTDGSLGAIHTISEDPSGIDGTTSFSYDEAGHVTERVNSPNDVDHATFQWDGDQLLSSLEQGRYALPSSEVTNTYEGGRIIRTDWIESTYGSHTASAWWEYDDQGRPSRLAWWCRDLFGGPDAPFPEHR